MTISEKTDRNKGEVDKKRTEQRPQGHSNKGNGEKGK